VINNLRDVEQDRKSGKRTLGVLLGENALRWEYTLMILLAYAIPPHFYFRLDHSLWIFLPFLAIPLAILEVKHVWTETDKSQLNDTLERTARFMVIFGLLFSAGIMVS
jgi:1,4-dihydroxy-2-naphthoate octaprenyltransferase